ncbi:hypothetical protein [Actinomadura geliboluensis]
MQSRLDELAIEARVRIVDGRLHEGAEGGIGRGQALAAGVAKRRPYLRLPAPPIISIRLGRDVESDRSDEIGQALQEQLP